MPSPADPRDPAGGVLIVGASLSGMSVAEGLRLVGHQGPITLVNAEPHPPYDRPPLSKTVLRSPATSFDDVALRPASWFAENDVQLLNGRRAVGLDVGTRTVTLDRGAIGADDIVIATGSRPRTLPALPDDPAVHTLRTWRDAQELGERLRAPGHLLVIGAGFIGLEVAAAALERGWRVTVVERDAAVLGRVLPAELAEFCWAPYAAAGAELRLRAGVVGVERSGDRLVTRLADGAAVTADAVVVAVGGQPNIEWLHGSGLRIDRGVRCDGRGRTSAPGVWAVGDAAQWDNGWTGRAERVEQWQSARNQATIVSHGLADRPTSPWNEPPYFWSDLLGGRIQFLGDVAPDSAVVLHRAGDRGIGLILRDDELRGVFAHRFPRAIAAARKALGEHLSTAAASGWAAGLLGTTPAPTTPTPTSTQEGTT